MWVYDGIWQISWAENKEVLTHLKLRTEIKKLKNQTVKISWSYQEAWYNNENPKQIM